MNTHKKKFIDKLKKKTKEELIEMVCNLYEEDYHQKKEIEHLHSLAFSHQQCLKFSLTHQSCKFIYEVVEEDDEEEPLLDRTKRDSVKSYV
jgi:hypothetical protein